MLSRVDMADKLAEISSIAERASSIVPVSIGNVLCPLQGYEDDAVKPLVRRMSALCDLILGTEQVEVTDSPSDVNVRDEDRNRAEQEYMRG